MPPVPPRRRRARPVADAPIDSLLTRSEDLTKGWLLALLEQAPLDEAPGILAADFTRDGPRLCEAVLRAIADDTNLRRLEPGGALTPLTERVGELAGATAPAAVSRAVDALRAVIWSAVRDELRSPDPDLVAELTERLTLVAELLRTAALERLAAPAAGERRASTLLRPAPSPDPPEPQVRRHAPEPPLPPHHAPAPPPTRHLAPEPPPPVAGSPRVAPQPAGPRSWPDDAQSVAGEPLDALWVGALEDEIHRSMGAPLSLLLAELEDADRVTAIEAPPEASATFSGFAGAVRSAVRRQDILVCETEARAWIIARDTSRQGAYALGERIADAVKQSGPWHGAPLAASVGVAVLGEDGQTSAELIEAAEEARFAAAASGVDVLRREREGDA